MTPEQIVREAIVEHGRPLWIAHVPSSVRTQVSVYDLVKWLAEAKQSPSTITRDDQYQSIVRWCGNNVFEEVTIADLETVSGLSAPSIRRFITDRPDLFRKLRRGVYEIRDPDADRKADQR